MTNKYLLILCMLSMHYALEICIAYTRVDVKVQNWSTNRSIKSLSIKLPCPSISESPILIMIQNTQHISI